MAVPGYQEFMLPLLQIAADGKEHTISEALSTLAARMQISEEDLQLMLPSGTQTRYYNRVTWATTYLTKTKLLEKLGRGRFRITDRGLAVLAGNPSRIDNAFLAQFPEYQAFKAKSARKPVIADRSTSDEAAEITPEERLEAASDELREALAEELLQRVQGATPKFFEHLVVRLLVGLGYGKGDMDRAQVTGKSGDDGIDGIIRQDRLGLDMVYVQAKKWDSAVGPGEIDKFVGSLMRKRANKGVFITSGTFTEGARRAAKEAAVKVLLIDGEELAEMMIDANDGVAVAETYLVKKVDADFFESVPL